MRLKIPATTLGVSLPVAALVGIAGARLFPPAVHREAISSKVFGT